VLEEVYSRTWYLGEEGKFIKCKEGSSWIWGEIEYKSKTIGEVRYGRGKRLQKRRVTREVHNKDVI